MFIIHKRKAPQVFLASSKQENKYIHAKEMTEEEIVIHMIIGKALSNETFPFYSQYNILLRIHLIKLVNPVNPHC